MLISNLLKKIEKNAPKKDIGKTYLTNMSKNEKVHISITFLLIIYFLCILKLFHWICNQCEILHFLIPTLNFLI
jgi:hypothetical protein